MRRLVSQQRQLGSKVDKWSTTIGLSSQIGFGAVFWAFGRSFRALRPSPSPESVCWSTWPRRRRRRRCMKRVLEDLHAPKTPFELKRIKFVPAQRPDVITVPEGINVVVLSAEPQVCADPARRQQTVPQAARALLS